MDLNRRDEREKIIKRKKTNNIKISKRSIHFGYSHDVHITVIIIKIHLVPFLLIYSDFKKH